MNFNEPFRMVNYCCSFSVPSVCQSFAYHGSVRNNLTMTNSHCNNQNTTAGIMLLTESLDRWMKNQSVIMFLMCFLSVLFPPSSSLHLAQQLD